MRTGRGIALSCVLFVMVATAAQAAIIDAPHNESFGVKCTDCHSYSLWWQYSPTQQSLSPNHGAIADAVCRQCHNGANASPAVMTHASATVASTAYGTWGFSCITCHNPHFQEQLSWASAGTSPYLVTGTVSSARFDSATNRTTLSYAGATVNSNWPVSLWGNKSVAFPGRGLILVLDTSRQANTYPIVSATETEMVVLGRIESTSIDPTYIDPQTKRKNPATCATFGLSYGQLVRRTINGKQVQFVDPVGAFALSGGEPVTGVCQACHTRTKYYRPEANGHYQESCRTCHRHGSGFGHAAGGNGTGCDACHGHSKGWGGNDQLGKGTHQSHSSHTEQARGPHLTCSACHDTSHFPFFRSGADANGDGLISLAETDVCNGCHSPGGPFDGVSDPQVGAKTNWRYDASKQAGIYNGSALAAGKERWCLTCHDSGSSLIPAGSTYRAPDVAGDNVTYGYFVSGHGAKVVDCGSCHDLTSNHNFDGKRTYRASTNNYRQGFRLNTVSGGEPFRIPAANDSCGYQASDFRLCFSCHDEQALLASSKADGTYECPLPQNLANQATIATGFRNVANAGLNGGLADLPANIHWDHLVDIHTIFSMSSFWDSDQDGTNDSKATCVTCHNPHGAARLQPDPATGRPLPTERMTVPSLDIQSGQDATGTYGQFGPGMTTSRCFMCHFSPGPKYYQASIPELHSLNVADRSVPVTAQIGFTNERAVTVRLDVTGSEPAEMRLAEQTFADATSGWQPLPNNTVDPSRTTEYLIAAPSDGPITIYAQVRNANGLSPVLSKQIVLDTAAPWLDPAGILVPAGAENWRVGSVQTISWRQLDFGRLGDVSTYPVKLELSTDGGQTYSHLIHGALWLGDTSYAWTVPNLGTSTARIRLSVFDRAGNVGRAVSTANFSIVP